MQVKKKKTWKALYGQENKNDQKQAAGNIYLLSNSWLRKTLRFKAGQKFLSVFSMSLFQKKTENKKPLRQEATMFQRVKREVTQ